MGFCRPLRRRCVLPLNSAENRLMLFRQLRVTVGGKHIGQITPRMPLQQTQQTLRQAREHHIMCRFRHNLMKRRIGRRLPFRIMLPVSRLQLRKPIAQTLQIRFRPPLRRQTCKQTLHTAAEIQYLVGHIVPAGHFLPAELQSLTHPRGNIMPVALPRIKASRAPTKSAKPPSTIGVTHRTLPPTAFQEAASRPPDKYSAKSVPQEYRQSVLRHTACRPFFPSASHLPPRMAARQTFQTA